MKNKHISLISITGLSIALLAGCTSGLFGANPAPPTTLEQKLFDTQTNYIPVVVTKTNIVETTNMVVLTNTVNNTVTTTNVITATPEVTTQTNQQAVYTETPKPIVTGTLQAAGTAASPFTAGIGTMVSGGLVLLLGIWGHLRSYKFAQTSTALADEIEAVRNYILTLPQGTKIDAAVTQFMQQHQTESGVAQTVLKLIDGNTSDPTIAGISAQLQTAINDLTNPPTPPKV